MAASDDSCMLCVHWAGVTRRAWPTHCLALTLSLLSVCARVFICVCVPLLQALPTNITLYPSVSASSSRSLFILSASVCVAALGVMLGLRSCERQHLSTSTWRQTGGHYQAQGQTLHSIFNYKITPYHLLIDIHEVKRQLWREQAVCLQSYSPHLFNQTSLPRIYHTLSLCLTWASSNCNCWLSFFSCTCFSSLLCIWKSIVNC